MTGLIAVAIVVAGGCTVGGRLNEGDTPGFRERALTSDAGRVRVSTSVLSAGESRALYGAPLAPLGIQPVWVEVQNRADRAYWLLFQGMAPGFFAASKAADIFAPRSSRSEAHQRFLRLAFRNPVAPGATVSGSGSRTHRTPGWAHRCAGTADALRPGRQG